MKSPLVAFALAASMFWQRWILKQRYCEGKGVERFRGIANRKRGKLKRR